MGEGDELHQYYELLPSYITPESISNEKQDFLRQIHETLKRLRDLFVRGERHDGEQWSIDACGDVAKRHFRVVDTFFQLKYALPEDLHADLIRVLIDLLWKREGKDFADVETEVLALRTLELLTRKWAKMRKNKTCENKKTEIAIDWHIAKNAIERVCFVSKGYTRLAYQDFLQQRATNTIKCVEHLRYFLTSTDATVPVITELWKEFGETIEDVKSTHCFKALAYFSLFFVLPYSSPGGTEDVAWSEVQRLLPRWFSAWSLISRCSEWDNHWMKIMSCIAKQYPSTTEWDPFLAFVFAKVQDILELPSDLGAPFKRNMWPFAYNTLNGTKRLERYPMRLCVYLLRNVDEGGVQPPANQYVLDIFSMVTAFFHPSNVANSANSIGGSIYYFSSFLLKRLGEEKGSVVIDSTTKLTLPSCRAILDALLEISFLGIYSKNRNVAYKCMYLIKNAICIDPGHCASPVLQEMMKALDPMAMSHSHLASTAISTMSVFLYHLMCGRHPASTGLFFSTYLTPLLKLTLPGIDANDEKKTMSTITLYFHLLSWLPLVNDTGKSDFQRTKNRGVLSKHLFDEMEPNLFAEMKDMDDEIDLKMWELGIFLEEWSLALLDRCFGFIKSRSITTDGGGHSSGSARNGGRGGQGAHSKKDAHEDPIVMEVLNLLGLLFPQMSPEIYTYALRKTIAFVSDVFFTSAFGGKIISNLILNCLHGNPCEAYPQFMALVLRKLHVSNDTINVANLAKNEKIWYLHLLDGVVRLNGHNNRFLLSHHAELRLILHHFLQIEDEVEVYEAAASILDHLLWALLGVYPTEFRSLPPAEWSDAVSKESGAFQYFGVSISWKNVAISWHEPNEEELLFGFELLHDHVIMSLDALESMQAKQDLSVRAWMPRLQQIFRGVRGAKNVLVDSGMPSNSAILSGAMPVLKKALSGNEELLNKYINLKPSLMKRVHCIVQFWRVNGTGSTMEIQIWGTLMDTISELLIWRGDHRDAYTNKKKQNGYIKTTTLDLASHSMRKARKHEQYVPAREQVLLVSRNELIERVVFFYNTRKFLQHFELAQHVFNLEEDHCTQDLYKSLLTDVEMLMKNQYEDVRTQAKSVMNEASIMYPKWIYSRLPDLISELEGKTADGSVEIKEETVFGVLNILSKSFVLTHFWKNRDHLLSRLLLVLLKSNGAILEKVDGEVSKAKVGVKIQGFFLALLAKWRYVRTKDVSKSLLQQLLAAEPASREHWKFQLMHLVALYPFLQSEEMPISMDLWKLVIKQMRNEVFPVRQGAIELFLQLIRLYMGAKKENKVESDSIENLLYSSETTKVLVDAFVDNHKSTNRFAASADGQHAASAPSNWSFGVNEVIRYLTNNANSFPKSGPLSSVRLLNQSSHIHTSTKIIQKLVEMNPVRFFESGIMDVINDLVTQKIDGKTPDEDRQAALSTLSECIGGMLRSLLKIQSLSEQDVLGHIVAVVDLMKKILPQLSIVLIDRWARMLYVISRPSRQNNLQLYRLDALTKFLLRELEDSFARATAEDYARQVKWLTLIESLAIHVLAASSDTSSKTDPICSMASEITDRVLRVICEHALTHQYKIIRDSVGKMLFLLGSYSSSSSTSLVSIPMQQLLDKALLTESNVTENSSEGGEEKPTSVYAKETAMQWLANSEKYGDARGVLAVLKELLPVALLTQNHSKAEIALLAKNTTDAISSSFRIYFVPNDSVNFADLESVFVLLEKLGAHRFWKTRGAVLRFLMTFTFYHWIFIPTEMKQRVHYTVSSFLADEQREVQAMAKYALRGLIHNERSDVVKAMSIRLIDEAQQSRTKYARYKRRYQNLKSENATAEELEKSSKRIKSCEDQMTRSVLGVSAIILAYPYSVPDYVPPIFEELGKLLYLKPASSTVSYLVKTVKETILEFKRTHQDNWLETKLKFTSAQLDVIEDVSISPNYYS